MLGLRVQQRGCGTHKGSWQTRLSERSIGTSPRFPAAVKNTFRSVAGAEIKMRPQEASAGAHEARTSATSFCSAISL